MVLMALPYTLTMALTGLITVMFLLPQMTDSMYESGMIKHHSAAEMGAQQDSNHH
jgi:NhaB family Na+:H+ antiporter